VGTAAVAKVAAETGVNVATGEVVALAVATGVAVAVAPMVDVGEGTASGVAVDVDSLLVVGSSPRSVGVAI
jgi:hypothetical protein